MFQHNFLAFEGEIILKLEVLVIKHRIRELTLTVTVILHIFKDSFTPQRGQSNPTEVSGNFGSEMLDHNLVLCQG